MKDNRIHRGRWLLIAVAAVCAARAGICLAEVSVSGRVTDEITDGVQVNVGTDQGLRQGVVGSLSLFDGRTFTFEVLHATRTSARLRLAGSQRTSSLLARTVELSFEPVSVPSGDATAEEAKRNQADAGTTDEFVPLLAPLDGAPQGAPRQNVSHGRIQVRQTLRTDSENDLDYSVTRVGSSGRIDRLEDTPWSFEWSGDVRYRDGDAYLRHPEYQEPHADVYRVFLQTSVDDGGFVRLGRFLPHELPGIGYVDGIQGETLRTEHLRLGVVGGLKPGRIDLEPSGAEPLVAGYATVEAGRRGATYYSGTVGLLNSYYEGRWDRLALLLDQRASLGRNFTLYSTTAADFDTGASETRDGTRLTRMDVTAVSRLSRAVTLRGGVDHWERPDLQAERDLLVFEDDRFFDDGYWRYWVGSNQNLPWKLGLYEEISFIESDTTDDRARWRVRVTRNDLFGWPQASASVTMYSLAAYENDGYGYRLSGYFPFNRGKLTVQPTVGLRTLETDVQSDDLSLTYVSVHLNGYVSKSWRVFGGFTYSSGDEVDSTLFDVGLRYSW